MDEKPLKSIVCNVLSRLTSGEPQKRSDLTSLWPSIAGEVLSERTKPRFGRDSCVVVWVDDSTLAFELSQRHKPVLLKRLQNQFGLDEVKDIKFFVGEAR